MSNAGDHDALTDEARSAVLASGALENLKQVSFDTTSSGKNDVEDLKQQAETVVENIQQLLDGGNLDDSAALKLSAALTKLRGALGNGKLSRAALTAALSEAAAAVNGAGDKGMSAQQKEAQLWQQIEADNKDIDDDFEKMRKAGINLNDGLWNKHKELMEYLKTHPRDIAKQKELDAVDDAMLLQAEPQMAKHPEAKPLFEDAKKKSDDRHQAVDRDLAGIDKNTSINNSVSMADFDENPKSANDKLTMNDVASPLVGQKPKPTSKQMG
ncbi:hypothetical protein [Mucilaginibacter paludis]|uniref:Uncharacterized protein n=1 Tax=Mucilaginibacter paludis DSM 18603 TaxID=714943 RepID=H1Y3L5_9SPHI|nr:hypothetical protein [Mucilaginibacter paludis]EHQ29783.1 hypothetical protein Mucpa_5714 [Mucilaginibacter paludis DSM 18603]